MTATATARSIVPCTVGTSVLDLLAAYRQILGDGPVDGALASLRPDARRSLTEITNVSWVPVDDLGSFVDTVGKQTGRDADLLLDEAVRLATTRTLSTVWRVLLRFTSDEAIIARTPIFWSKSRNIGKLDAQMVSAGRSQCVLSRWPGVSPRHLRTLAISMETLIRLAGRKNVKIVWEPTGDGARYALSWRE